MANRRFIDFPIASTSGDTDIILIWQDGANKQTTKATFLSGLPENLDDLNDVAISGLTNGQILRYDSVTGKWENTDQGNLDLNDLNDVSIVSPSNGQVLVYNSSTSKWENSSGGYVPYTGAVTTVNLGAQTIQAGSFVKVGGTSSQFLKADGSVDSNTYGTGTVTSVALTMPAAFSVANSPVTTAGTLAVTGAGNASQYIAGDGTLVTFPALTGYVPYTGANQTVDLNTQQLQAGHTTLTTNGSTETLTINHTSGSGKAINVTKGGAGEGLYVNKTSGSGNAATIVGTLEATTLVKTGGTSSQFLKADGSVDSTSYGTGTVTSVGLSSATSGVTIGSTPVTTSGTITLAISTASGSQNGLLSSTDWTTFNNKANSVAGGYLPLSGGTMTGVITTPNGTFGIIVGDDSRLADRNTANTLFLEGIQDTDRGYINFSETSGNALGAINGGNLTWRGNAVVTGTGTTNYLPKFTGSTTIGNSQVFDNGSVVSIGTNATLVQTLNINSTYASQSLNSTSGNFAYIGLLNGATGGGFNFAVEGSTGGTFGTGSTAYAGVLSRLGAYNLQFATDNVVRATITSGGNVLIGTTTDSGGKLRVDGDVFINNSSNAQIGLNTTGALNSVGAYLYFNRSGSNKWTAGMGPYTGGNNYEIATGSMVALSLTVTTGVATFGSLGTGTVSATSGTLSTTSDLNYKIEDGFIDSAIEKVLSLKPRYFYWNEKSGLPTNIRQLGFYAQEVNEVLGEEAANTPKNENTPWGISDRSMIAYLTKAIQELKKEIDTLKN
jgi:hypothetical protein